MTDLHRVGRGFLPLTLIATLLIVSCPRRAAAQKGEKPLTRQGGSEVTLSIAPERAARVKALQGAMNRTTLELKERLHERTQALEQLYRSYQLDEAQCRRLRQEIRDTQDQLMDHHHRFQVELRGLLTQAEFETLQQRFLQARAWKLKSARRVHPETKLKALHKGEKSGNTQKRELKRAEVLKRQKQKWPEGSPKQPKQKTTEPAKKEIKDAS